MLAEAGFVLLVFWAWHRREQEWREYCETLLEENDELHAMLLERNANPRV